MELAVFYNVPCEAKMLTVCETLDAMPKSMMHAHQMGHDNGCGMFSVRGRVSLWKYTVRTCEKPRLWRDMEKP